ncbi:MAG: hypothetical protein R6V27_10420 [Balneolaceae bacterium]
MRDFWQSGLGTGISHRHQSPKPTSKQSLYALVSVFSGGGEAYFSPPPERDRLTKDCKARLLKSGVGSVAWRHDWPTQPTSAPSLTSLRQTL